MRKSIIHISDLHYVGNRAESYGLVLSELFQDIGSELANLSSDRYLLFSGDIVREGSDSASYDEFLLKYQPKLDSLGLSRDRRICVPGNHDVSREALKSSLIEHEGMISLCTSEQIFLQHVSGKEIFRKKFDNYSSFEQQFAAFGVGDGALGGGYALSDKIGVYCLNSAYFSSAGLGGPTGSVSDQSRLVVDTRGLHEWLQKTSFSTRILVMHHPLEWLAEWSAREIRALLGKRISLLATGHTHEQEGYARNSGAGGHIHCMAPALFTSKEEELGYSVISINDQGVESILYRQWVPKYRKFVSGTAFSSTDSGRIDFRPGSVSDQLASSAPNSNLAVATQGVSLSRAQFGDVLRERLNTALAFFSGHPTIFVEPVLSEYSEVAGSRSEKPKPTYGIEGLIDRGFPAAVHAPPQFGLTCLARAFCCIAWESRRQLWLYVDASETKPNRHAIGEAVRAELHGLNATMADVHGIVVDSVKSSERDSIKLVHKAAEAYPGLDVLIMRSNDAPGEAGVSEISGKAVRDSFLWSMPRAAIRKVVSQYNDIRPLGDEDVITSRLALDLEMMNIHRTPLNCFTLLKVSEVQYEESPVNRAELIKRVLYVLFNGGELPTYKSRPDVKDCEFILGYFCEQIIREDQSRFLGEKFRSTLGKFCAENLLDIDVDWVFDVLYQNNIIVSRGHWFEFRFTYWVMYFAAQRMCQSLAFRDFVFDGARYAAFPEIIEFYTGINRSMNDAVSTIAGDLRGIIDEFDSKIALPEGFDIFSSAQWQPSESALEQMREDTSRGVGSSNLPESVKDQYADRRYDSARPYEQDIKSALKGFSYNKMLQSMRAAARALRNSDYVDTLLKRKLLAEIIAVWERAATVILVLVPALTKNGEAVFDDVRYVLGVEFPEDLEQRFLTVLQEIPRNIAGYYEDDLFSHKMGPLLARELHSGSSNMARHLVALVLIRHRPKGWSATLKEYISGLPRNSFYLLDVYKCLRVQYQFGYAGEAALSELAHLIKACAARHITGAKELGRKKVEQIAASIQDGDGEEIVPPRRVDAEGEFIEPTGPEGEGGAVLSA